MKIARIIKLNRPNEPQETDGRIPVNHQKASSISFFARKEDEGDFHIKRLSNTITSVYHLHKRPLGIIA